MNIVWYKRDLRIMDHAPLSAATADGPTLALYIDESHPDYRTETHADVSERHRHRIGTTLIALRYNLASREGSLAVLEGEATACLTRLMASHPFKKLYAYQETGNLASYARDLAVHRWCRDNGVQFIEFPQNGVIRASRSKGSVNPSSNTWRDHLQTQMERKIEPLPRLMDTHNLAGIPITSAIEQAARPEISWQSPCPTGRFEGMSVLNEFLDHRLSSYAKDISSPLTAVSSCSRLSAHLAYGTVSAGDVARALQIKAAETFDSQFDTMRHMRNLQFFADRLLWRANYYQLAENYPDIEARNLDQRMNGLRDPSAPPLAPKKGTVVADLFDMGPALRHPALAIPEDERLDRWARGETGYPMVDASMRMLTQTGWLNMRMRGLLISFSVNELWLDWRKPALHLARLFTDYDPPIHWMQTQIHASCSGMETLLSYNPVKQQADQDPEGKFATRWIPELHSGTYAKPILDHKTASRAAPRSDRGISGIALQN